MAKIEAEKAEAAASGSGAAGDNNKGASSIFHGKADKDYQGEPAHRAVGPIGWCVYNTLGY